MLLRVNAHHPTRRSGGCGVSHFGACIYACCCQTDWQARWYIRKYSWKRLGRSEPPSTMKQSVGLLSLVSAIAPVLAGTYSRTQNIVGTGFYNAFEFEAIGDPTQGRVNYVDRATAQAQNLTFASADKFVLRTDATTVIGDGSPVGRNSVRIRTTATYTTHVAVFDIQHMPQGCGTWPAVWETDEDSWPRGGEVDILEGVNDQGPNQITLHTSPGCTMPASRDQTGTSLQLDCDTNVNNNVGCGVNAVVPTSYGPTFNANGGGWYAVERTNSFINVWFWSRSAGNVPADVAQGGSSVDTSTWGTPTANFPSTSCNIPEFFSPNNIIINLTLCGDWAGSVYPASGCPGTCNEFVDKNPTALAAAYFEFNSINVYQ
ncbi:putative glycosidase C21B10.07 [Mycena indigotica]|uniref:Putative glycosidase C21B10.07 n=1 Tax=Mycena indigotica TaxID=2126181 RepID=A0A8H6SHK5_9AGAR|nr:putative glycosidase C21B10.07 [Mycena indigotica]KAF7298826.1 putative glycosidase C21B10.07 [Mycena indigotica]